MSNLCPFKKLLCLLLLAIAICIIPVKASSMTFQEYEGIRDAFTNARTELTDTVSDFYALKSERDDVKSEYDSNAEEIRDQGIVAAHQGVALGVMASLGPIATTELISELRAAILNAHLTAHDLVDHIRLSKALDIAINKTDELRTKIGDPANGSQQATGLFKKRDDAYDAYVKAYKEYYSPSATPTLTKGRQNAPIDNKSFSYGCFGSDDCDDTFGSPHAAMTSHFTRCEEYPHKDQEFGWYSCERSSCAKPEEHKGECGKHKITEATRNAHLKLADPQRCPVTHEFTHQLTGVKQVFQCVITRRYVCDASITDHYPYHQFNPNPQLGESKVYPPGYASDSLAQNPQTPVDNSPNCEYCTGSCSACTQPTTPAMHPCGVHATSVSGDHSLQASCTVTNGWFHSCTVTNFYACQTHTCVFPTFQCGRRVNGYRVCNESVSDEQEHYVICPNGHSHWSCKSEDYNHHRLRTCGNLYSSGTRCNNTWRRCRFYPEPISGTGLSTASPLCPTDKTTNTRRCAE